MKGKEVSGNSPSLNIYSGPDSGLTSFRHISLLSHHNISCSRHDYYFIVRRPDCVIYCLKNFKPSFLSLSASVSPFVNTNPTTRCFFFSPERSALASVLAWKIPRTEEPGRLQSMGLQRVGCNWATWLHFTERSRETACRMPFWKCEEPTGGPS